MSRSISCTLALTIVLAVSSNAATAAGYDSGWQDQTTYRGPQTVSYDDSHSQTRVIHRMRGYSPWGYTVRRRAVTELCH